MREAIEASAQLFCFCRRLIDDRAPIHYLDEPPWQLCSMSLRDEPDRHHRGLAESGRQIERPREDLTLVAYVN